jgi:hypothetical protein
MVGDYFKKKGLTDDAVASHLHAKLEEFLKAIEAKDEAKVRALTEPTFGEKLIKTFETRKDLQYIRPEKSGEDETQEVVKEGKAFIVDKLFIKGMNLDRRKNDTNFDYYYFQKMEKYGLRAFVHRFNTGDFHYYLMRDLKQSIDKAGDESFAETDPDSYHHFHRKTQNDLKAYKNEMFNKEYQLILRVVLQLTDGALGKFSPFDYNEAYTGNHIAIFEAQLRTPPALAMLDNTYEQFVNEHRLNFKNWRLVDLDNFMQGNSYYSEYVSQETWVKRNKDTWDDSEMNEVIETEEDLEPLHEMIEKMQSFLATKEPQSNYDMPIRNRKKAEQAAREEAERAAA